MDDEAREGMIAEQQEMMNVKDDALAALLESKAFGETVIHKCFQDHPKKTKDDLFISIEDALSIAKGMSKYIHCMKLFESRMKEWHRIIDEAEPPITIRIDESPQVSEAPVAPAAPEIDPDKVEAMRTEENERIVKELRREIEKLEETLLRKREQHEFIANKVRELELREVIAEVQKEEEEPEPCAIFQRFIASNQAGATGNAFFDVQRSAIDPAFCAETTESVSKGQLVVKHTELLFLVPKREAIDVKRLSGGMVFADDLPFTISLCIAQAGDESPNGKLLFTLARDQKTMFLMQREWNAVIERMSVGAAANSAYGGFCDSSSNFEHLAKLILEQYPRERALQKAKAVEVVIGTGNDDLLSKDMDLFIREYEGIYWMEMPFLDVLHSAPADSKTSDQCKTIQDVLTLLHALLCHTAKKSVN